MRIFQTGKLETREVCDPQGSYLGRSLSESGLYTNKYPVLHLTDGQELCTSLCFSLGCWLNAVWVGRGPEDSGLRGLCGALRKCPFGALSRTIPPAETLRLPSRAGTGSPGTHCPGQKLRLYLHTRPHLISPTISKVARDAATSRMELTEGSFWSVKDDCWKTMF